MNEPQTFSVGEFIADEATERGWKQADLAEALGMPVREADALISGEKRVTANLAERLGRAFGTTPALWLNLQKHHDKENRND